MDFYGELPNGRLKASRIFYGTAFPAMSAGADQSQLLDEVYDCGINAFDTARVYGKSEDVLGRWMASRKNREKLILLTKGGHPDLSDGRKRISEKEIRSDLEKSLQKLGTDYVDLYLLHRDDPDVPVGEIVEWMNAMAKEGKIRAFGGSNWTRERIAEANRYAEAHSLQAFQASSPNYGVADQVRDLWGGGSVTLSGPSKQADRDWYAKEAMPVIAYSSLAHGFFAGKFTYAEREQASKYLDEFAIKGYLCPENLERLRRAEELAAQKHCSVAQIAMGWMFHQGLNMFAIVSTTSAERMKQNIAALELSFTREELELLN